MKYRAEIDGLRAIAVIPVILFHAGFELFCGGFVGVDVFLVISGYLITSILIEDLENERFSIVNFYERRARRLLPALFFVMLVCIPFAWMWMLPVNLRDFSQSLLAVLIFASNVLFWRESDYFGTDAEMKPLLHTWSLGVEEQFYVLLPIFLFFTWRFGKDKVFWMMVVMASISLILTESGWRNAPSANFYLAPTRAWELFSGSIAAIIINKRDVQNNNFLSLLGLAAILFSVFAYNETTPFPSIYTMVPVLGVVLIILFAGELTLVTRLLSAKLFVGVGLCSYSVYLWHQPILAFYKYKFEQYYHSSAIIVLLSILFGYLTWRFLERPFRNKLLLSRFKLNLFLLFGFLVLSFVGLVGSFNLGNVLTLIKNDPYSGIYARRLVATPEQFAKNKFNDFIVYGDSFADALTYPLNDVTKGSDVGFLSFIKHSCPSLIDTYRNAKDLYEGFGDDCYEFNKDVMYRISKPEHSGKYIVITSSYYYYSTGKNIDDEPILISTDGDIAQRGLVVDSLFQTVKWAEKNGLNPIVVLSPPKFENFREIMRKNINEAKSIITPIDEIRELNNRLAEVLQTTKAKIIDPLSVLCKRKDNKCEVYNSEDEQFIVWYDGSHLSEYGAQLISKEIVNALKLNNN